MYGKLTVAAGCMFAGKTTYIISACQQYNSEEIMVFKPAMDTRYSRSECVSHDGMRISALPIRSSDELVLPHGVKLVCIDEAQFFSPQFFDGDIIKIIKSFLEDGRSVIASGLDMDWRGDPFPITSFLMGMADEVIKLKAKCSICGDHASKTYKKSGEGEVVELGSGDIYSARCNLHWMTGD